MTGHQHNAVGGASLWKGEEKDRSTRHQKEAHKSKMQSEALDNGHPLPHLDGIISQLFIVFSVCKGLT
jgi:hypothetical protein